MSDQDTTAAVAQADSPDRAPSEDLVEVQVVASGVSYFRKEYVRGPDGKPNKLPNGEKQFVTLRHEATLGDVIQVHPYEASQLVEGGFVREPSDKPLLPPLRPTPFSTPLAVGPNGEVQAFEGPIMGDPRPNTADETGQAADRKPLTPEEAAELERREQERDEVDEFDANEATDDELAEYLSDKNVKETLAVAKGPDGEYDPQVAARVLEAELERDKPRDGVVGPLEDVE